MFTVKTYHSDVLKAIIPVVEILNAYGIFLTINVVHGYTTTMVRRNMVVYEFDACDKYGRFPGTSHLLLGN